MGCSPGGTPIRAHQPPASGLILALVVALFVAWRASNFFTGTRPIPLPFGWGVLQKGVGLLGPPIQVVQASTGLLSFALLLALIAGGFQRSRVWGRVASGLIGLAGTAAAIPLAVMAGVVLLNLLLWVLAIALTSFALMLWVPIGLLYLLLRR